MNLFIKLFGDRLIFHKLHGLSWFDIVIRPYGVKFYLGLESWGFNWRKP